MSEQQNAKKKVADTPPPAQAGAARAVMRKASGGTSRPSSSIHATAAKGVSGSASRLPHMDRIQASFGRHNVSGIRAHLDGAAQQASAEMGAEAYATGDRVAFKRNPDLHTAAHEAAHVVQQRLGRAPSSGVGQAGDAYEQHADSVADRVVAGQSAEDLLDSGPLGRKSAAVQKSEGSGGESGEEDEQPWWAGGLDVEAALPRPKGQMGPKIGLKVTPDALSVGGSLPAVKETWDAPTMPPIMIPTPLAGVSLMVDLGADLTIGASGTFKVEASPLDKTKPKTSPVALKFLGGGSVSLTGTITARGGAAVGPSGLVSGRAYVFGQGEAKGEAKIEIGGAATALKDGGIQGGVLVEFSLEGSLSGSLGVGVDYFMLNKREGGIQAKLATAEIGKATALGIGFVNLPSKAQRSSTSSSAKWNFPPDAPPAESQVILRECTPEDDTPVNQGAGSGRPAESPIETGECVPPDQAWATPHRQEAKEDRPAGPSSSLDRPQHSSPDDQVCM